VELISLAATGEVTLISPKIQAKQSVESPFTSTSPKHPVYSSNPDPITEIVVSESPFTLDGDICVISRGSDIKYNIIII
jgi:hypothetical protein